MGRNGEPTALDADHTDPNQTTQCTDPMPRLGAQELGRASEVEPEERTLCDVIGEPIKRLA